MTRSAEFEQLDLPTRRTQEPEIGRCEIGIVDHQRVELVQRQSLPSGLDDDQSARVAESAPAAFSVEELDQLESLSEVSTAFVRAAGFEIRFALSCGVSTIAGRGELSWLSHPMDD